MSMMDLYRAQYHTLLKRRDNIIADLADINVQLFKLVQEAKDSKIDLLRISDTN